jgi:hypothetical protein
MKAENRWEEGINGSSNIVSLATLAHQEQEKETQTYVTNITAEIVWVEQQLQVQRTRPKKKDWYRERKTRSPARHAAHLFFTEEKCLGQIT